MVICSYILVHPASNEQGFRQDEIIASHTCFSGHMDVNC